MARSLSMAIPVILLLCGCTTGVRGSPRYVCHQAGFDPATPEFTDCWHKVRDRQFRVDMAGMLVGIAALPQPSQPVPRNEEYRPLIEIPERKCVYQTPQGVRTLLVRGACPFRYDQ